MEQQLERWFETTSILADVLGPEDSNMIQDK